MRNHDTEPSALWTAAMFLSLASEFRDSFRSTDQSKNASNCTESDLMSDSWRRTRYRQLSALARAFDVQPGFQALYDGTFLKHRPPQMLALLNDTILSDVTKNFPWILEMGKNNFWPVDPDEAGRIIYLKLTGYLFKAYALLRWNSGVSMASGAFLYMVKRMDLVNEDLRRGIEPIERVTELFIAADGRGHPVSELVDLGWPLRELNALDGD